MDKLMEEIAKELTVDMIQDEIWRDLAEEIGVYNVIKFMELVNGESIYIPKPDRTLASARDAKIMRELNGHNHEILARKYNLSKTYIKKLCKKLDLKSL